MYGVVSVRLPLVWPLKQPDEYADWSYDATLDLTDAAGVVDPIVSAQVAASPSGAGEMALSNLSLSGNLITVWLGGGVPGRTYLVNIEVVTRAGRVYQFPLSIQVNPYFASQPSPPPPSTGYGPTLNWTAPT